MAAANQRVSVGRSDHAFEARTVDSTEQRQRRSKTKMCKFFQQNTCRHGAACSYAHGEEELKAVGGSQQKELRDWNSIGQQRRQAQNSRIHRATPHEHISDTNFSGMAAGPPPLDEAVVPGERNAASSPDFFLQACNNAQTAPWIPSPQPQSSNGPPAPHSFQQQPVQESLQPDQFRHCQQGAFWHGYGLQPQQSRPLQQQPQQLPMFFVPVPSQQQQFENSTLYMPQQQQSSTEQALGSNGLMMMMPSQPLGMQPAVMPMVPIAPQSAGTPAQTTRFSGGPTFQQSFGAVSVSAAFHPAQVFERSQPEPTGPAVARPSGRNQQQQPRPRFARVGRALAQDEMDTRMTELLSLVGNLEVDQARMLLEACSWNVPDAFDHLIGRSRQRRRQAANDADLQEAIRRSMIEEEYSGGFGASALTKEVIAAETFTSLYCCTDGEAEECAICLASFEDATELRTLKCGHAFHKKCIDQWLSRSGQCALCKQPVGSNGSNSN